VLLFPVNKCRRIAVGGGVTLHVGYSRLSTFHSSTQPPRRSSDFVPVPYRTDPWLRSRPPTRPPRQPRANQGHWLDYRRRRGGPTEVNYGASVRPRRSLVSSPNFESVTPFHGMAMPSGDRRVVKNDGNDGAPPSAKIGARGNAYLTIKS